MINIDSILITIALVILIGYLGDYLFRVTRLPEAVILMLIGMLLVPIGHIIPDRYVSLLKELAPLFGDIALVVIMFDGGRRISFQVPLSSWGLGLTLAVLDIILPMAILTPFMYYVFNWPPIYGAILGTILGETTSTVIIPIAVRLNISEYMYNVIVMEATLNSVVSILVFYLLQILLNGNFTLQSYVKYTISYFSIAVFLGLLVGILWLIAVNWIRGTRTYVVTVAIAFLLYGIVDLLGGAAVVAVLIFAIIIGNYELISQHTGLKIKIDEDMLNIVENELEFLVRTFFYVLIGIIAIISLYYTLLALLITGLLVAIRFIEVNSLVKDQRFSKLLTTLVPRGLTAAVLASMMLNMNYPPYSQEIFYITFMVIVFTNIIASIMLAAISREVKVREAYVK
mgnify:CR=1 FL=1